FHLPPIIPMTRGAGQGAGPADADVSSMTVLSTPMINPISMVFDSILEKAAYFSDHTAPPRFMQSHWTKGYGP
ncbi:MAG: hypothetical protein AAGJ92_09675, partial [Pseudomonadota bacterium]